MTQIVSGALEAAGHIGIGRTPPNRDLTYALGVLNDMLHGWRAKGVDIGHVTRSASETVNLLAEHDEAVKILLATHPRIVARFGFPVDPRLMEGAHDAWSVIYAAYGDPGPAPQDSALGRMPIQSEGIGRR